MNPAQARGPLFQTPLVSSKREEERIHDDGGFTTNIQDLKVTAKKRSAMQITAERPSTQEMEEFPDLIAFRFSLM